MEPQSLILGIIITALAALIVLWPFVSPSRERQDAAAPAAQAEALSSQRDAIYATIRDLDFDFETGKLTEDDYRAQREMWVERGVGVLKALDALGAAPIPVKNGHPPQGDSPIIPPAPTSNELEERIEAAVASRRRTA